MDLSKFLEDVTEENIIAKTKEFLNTIRNNYVSAPQCKVMFALHNKIFVDTPEHNQSCPPCRKKVYNRLKLHVENNK